MRHIISLFRFFLICSAKNYVFIIFEFDLCHSHFINIKQTFISTFSDIHTFIYIRTAFIFVLSFISPFRFAIRLYRATHQPCSSLSLSHPSTRLACSLYVLMPRRHTIIIHYIYIYIMLSTHHCFVCHIEHLLCL